MNIGYQYTDSRTVLDGITLDKVFIETDEQGLPLDSPKFDECINYLRTGDTLYIQNMDMLGQNLQGLNKVVDMLTGKGVVVFFVKEKIQFSDKDEDQKALNVLGKAAAFERSTAQRCLSGKIGRMKVYIPPEEIDQALADDAKGVTKTALAKRLGISRQTLYVKFAERKRQLSQLAGQA